MAFAEDVSDDISHQDNIIAISENDNIQTASQQTISAGSNSTTIQNTINSMSDGDTLNFEQGTYTDICIYVDKSITIKVKMNPIVEKSLMETDFISDIP